MKRRAFIIATIITGAILAAGFSSQAFAHGGKGKHGFDIDKRVEKMTRYLELTDAQAAQVRTILENKKETFEKLKAQNLERDEKHTRMRELRRATKQEIAEVLDDEQREKAKKFLERRREMRGDRGGPFSEKHIEKTAERLGLSDEQVSRIQSIVDDARAERELIVEAAGGDRRAALPELKAHHKKVRAKIKDVMTTEQLERARELRKRHKRRGHHHDG